MINIFIPRDNGGCGMYRITLPKLQLDSSFSDLHNIVIDKSHQTFDPELLCKTKNIIIQAPINSYMQMYIEKLIKLRTTLKAQFRLIYEIDDNMFEIPSYNHIGIATYQYLDRYCLKYFDKFIFSTNHLAEYHIEKFNLNRNLVFVLPNTLMKGLMYSPQEYLTKNLNKVKVLIAGSSNHYSRPKNDNGDYSEGLIEFIVNGIIADEIELHIIGSIPPFLFRFYDKLNHKRIYSPDNIQCKVENIILHNWVDFIGYFELLREISPDVFFASLMPNKFNMSKSNVKMIESYGLPKTVFIGTKFDNSPYSDALIGMDFESNSKEIKETIEKLKNKTYFNSIVSEQKKYLIDNNFFSSDIVNHHKAILEV